MRLAIKYVVFAVVAIPGAVLITYGLQGRANFLHLNATGNVAVARPIHSYIQQKSGRHVYYLAVIHFVTDTGKQVRARRYIDKTRIDDIAAGRPLRVRYDADNPDDFIYDKEEGSWLPAIVGIAVPLFVLLILI